MSLDTRISYDSHREWPPEDLENVNNCPVCDSKESSLLYEGLEDKVFFCAPGKWSLYQCKVCSSAFLNPRPTSETIGRAYENYYTHEIENPGELNLINRIRRAIANGYRNKKYGTHATPSIFFGSWLIKAIPSQKGFIDAGMRHLPLAHDGGLLLDVGCGNGDFLVRAKDAGWNVIGVDLDSQAIEVARNRGIDVRHGSLDQVKEYAGKFDGITISHVIEHIYNPRDLLASCYELLKPGGWLWIETPNIDAPTRKMYNVNWRGLEPPRHLIIYSNKGIEVLLKQMGYMGTHHLPFRNLCYSLCTQSETIARGTKAGISHHTLLNSLRCFIFGLRARVSIKHREFITIKTYKDI